MTPTPKRILVIDDDDQVRATARKALQRAGYDVRDAADAAAGLRLLRERPADLVVTDIYMPGQDGLETIRQLRKEWPTTKIVTMSGGSQAGPLDLQEHARALGAHRTLAKPFRLQEFLALVAALLDEAT